MADGAGSALDQGAATSGTSGSTDVTSSGAGGAPAVAAGAAGAAQSTAVAQTSTQGGAANASTGSGSGGAAAIAVGGAGGEGSVTATGAAGASTNVAANNNGGAAVGGTGGAQGALGGADTAGGAGGANMVADGGAGGGAVNQDPDARRLVLRDEGLSRLTYVDLGNPGDNWSVDVPAGRDLQLVGSGRVLIGTENGFEERAIVNGEKLGELTGFPGTLAAQRLASGSNLLVGVDWQGQTGITLVIADAGGSVSDTITYSGYSYARLVRPTSTGTYLVTADTQVFEGDADGDVVWQVTVANHDEPHAWKALRLADGNTVVSTGYAASLQVFSPGQQLVDTITGPGDVNPYFFADLQVLASGNYLVANWQGHGDGFGSSGNQLLEYDAAGDLVWSWEQDASLVSSLQGAIVLDGLDLERLHVEGADGKLVPVP